MPWVRFKIDYSFRLRPNALVAYKAGMRVLVCQRCYRDVLDYNAAVPVDRPEKKQVKDAGRQTS